LFPVFLHVVQQIAELERERERDQRYQREREREKKRRGKKVLEGGEEKSPFLFLFLPIQFFTHPFALLFCLSVCRRRCRCQFVTARRRRRRRHSFLVKQIKTHKKINNSNNKEKEEQ
jgi:hypothetical protein